MDCGEMTVREASAHVNKILERIRAEDLGTVAQYMAAWFEDHGVPMVVLPFDVKKQETASKPKPAEQNRFNFY